MIRTLVHGGLILLCAMTAMQAAADGKLPAEKQRPAKTPNLIENQQQGSRLPIKKERYLFSVTLHKQDEIQSLLSRADKLSRTVKARGNESSIALILHGPEIRFFTNNNYKKNRALIDRAAKLDGDEVIELKVCKTKMKELGISDKEIPSFVEIIPYAPEEEKKLLKKGYVYL